MKNENPFSLECMARIFNIRSEDPIILKSRETTDLEFKESFGFKSLAKYSKTMAAFANTKGGYIVFGVKNKPHKVVGLQSNEFEDLDPAKLTEFLNDSFSPEIKWERNEHTIGDYKIGMIYTYESEKKPVVCTKNASGILKEGEIYYSYRGKREKIRYSELMSMIDDIKNKERNHWMGLFNTISKIGVQNVAVLDTVSGELTGTKGTVLVDESILEKVSFIQEGKFSETEGSPTLRLIGEAEIVNKSLIQPTKTKTIRKTKTITTENIILDFLNEEPIEEPLSYIKQICFEPSVKLPIYYYIGQKNLGLEYVLNEIDSTSTFRQKTKELLKKKLQNGGVKKKELKDTGSSAYLSKKNYYDQLTNKDEEVEVPNEQKELRYFLQSILFLTKEEIEKNKIKEILKKIFNDHFKSNTIDIKGDFREAICYVDSVLFCR